MSFEILMSSEPAHTNQTLEWLVGSHGCVGVDDSRHEEMLERKKKQRGERHDGANEKIRGA